MAAAGEIIAGNYRVVRKLGEGWGGVAYEVELVNPAFSRSAGSRFALKVYKPEAFASERNLAERVRREAAIGGRIEHANVLKIHALEEYRDGDRDAMALVMDLCLGGDLTHHLATNFPYDEPALLSMMRQLTGGLVALHTAGIVHRDVKPQNVLITETGAPRIGDFGVVRHKDDLTMTSSGQFLGTIRYSAPEYLFGTEYDASSDVYSLGAVFYELLYGTPVFASHKRFSNLVRAIELEPVSFPESSDRFGRDPGIVHVVGEALARLMLQRDPAKRPSMANVRRSLMRGWRRGVAFDAINRRCATLIRTEFDSIAPGRGNFIFHSYTSHRLLDAISDADLVTLIAGPDPGTVLRREEYQPLATQVLPENAEYVTLPLRERVQLLAAVARDRPYYFSLTQESAEANIRIEQYWRFLESYVEVEPVPRLRRCLVRQRDSLGLDEHGHIWPFG
jgi:serine/threonine protein kinase